MARVEKSIEIEVPVHTAYNQWTQFEEFPHFMDGVKEVRQLDDKRLHWKADIGGKTKEWDAEIQEQTPDQRIAWRSISGTQNFGQVSFNPINADRTRVSLLLDYEPEGMMEKAGDAMGVVSGKVQGDLERFKDFIESRGRESGAWRGEIHGGKEHSPGSSRSGGSGMGKPSSGSNLSGGTTGGTTRSGGSPMGGSTIQQRKGTGTPKNKDKNTPGTSASRSGSARVDPEDMDDDLNAGTPKGRR